MISDVESIPPTWNKMQFREIAQIVTERIDNPKESGLDTYIGLEHLDTDEVRIKRYGTPDEVGATKFICKKGDIIFGKRRAYLRKLAVSDRAAVVSAHSMVLRPNTNKINTEFLPCFMQSSQFWRIAYAISEGSLSPTIKWKSLATQQVWLPPLNEQKQIAKILWALEDNLEKLEKLIQVTQKLKDALLEELVIRGIRHKKFKQTEIGMIPDKWEVKKLDYEIELCYGKGLPEANRIKGEFPVYGSNGIVGTHDKFLVEGPGIVIGRKGSVGEVKFSKRNFWPIDTTYYVKLRKGGDIQFWYYLMLTLRLDKMNSHSAVPGLNRDVICEIRKAIPAIEEQSDIAAILSTIDKALDRYIENQLRLKELKKKLTNDLISGKLLIPNGVKL